MDFLHVNPNSYDINNTKFDFLLTILPNSHPPSMVKKTTHALKINEASNFKTKFI